MNIIEIALNCGFDADDEVTVKSLEHFAALVLEEAAKACDKRAHAGDAGALMAARAIRALKGAKE